MNSYLHIKIWVVLLIMLSPAVSAAGDNQVIGKPEKKFRVGYLEEGPFWAFGEVVKATKKSLEEMGWINRVEFPEDAHFSVGQDSLDLKKNLTEKASELMKRKDLDMIITAGTPATAAALKVNNGYTPIFAIAVSDPIKSKFVDSEKDSGVDNFTARIVPDRFKQMFTIFHQVVGFKKLGLIYTDDENGKLYVNLDDAREIAKIRGFQLVEYKQNKEPDTEACLKGINWLIQNGIDAFYQSALFCFDWNHSDVNKLFVVLNEHKIPIFARDGTIYVKAGALMGFSSIDFSPRGNFNANKMIRIFQGEKPRTLPMVDASPPKISFNLKVAEKIGFDPPYDVIGASDEMFREIILPEKRLVK